MHIDEQLVRSIVSQVLAEVGPPPPAPPVSNSPSATKGVGRVHGDSSAPRGDDGVFDEVDQAISAARAAFEQFSSVGMDGRKRAIDVIRDICRQQCTELGTREFEETGVGRLPHKIEKLGVLADKCPGVEFMNSQVFSGDHGLTVIEHAPFGVIAAITPVTHSLPTLAGNAINMLAAGNTVVVNPHPSGKRIAAEGVQRFNRAIRAELGIDNLICIIREPTVESAEVMFRHNDIALICVTGGPAVARAALAAPKRAIVAGPGNPPVVIDPTADIDRAARSIIRGGSYDNNLLCIGEKSIFVVDEVLPQFVASLTSNGAVALNEPQIEKLTTRAIDNSGQRKYPVATKEFIGRDASFLADAAGVTAGPAVELLYGVTDAEHPFVSAEQMMPFVPVVACRDVDEAIARAKHYEHGFRHTSIVHSNNVATMTRMGRTLDSTLFVKNGPCMSGLGLGGEGYFSYSIAGPTGEGVTTPLTFTRERRCAMIDDLWILGTAEN